MKIGTVLLFANFDHPTVAAHARTIESWAARHKIALKICRLLEEPPSCTPDLILTIGGDGTFLKAARYAALLNTPLMGFHIGGLGFLPQALAEDAESALDELQKANWQTERRFRIGGNFNDGETGKKIEFSALNEMVVSHSRPDRFTDIELWREKTLLASYPGDGVIVATPTGSTAYSLSAGGPIAEPGLPVFVVTPLASHQLAIRPLVLSAEKALRLTARFPAQVMVDGERVGALAPNSQVEVYKSPLETRFVVLSNRLEFFDRLRKKLGWSQVLYRKNQVSGEK
jgi:NAD+ kinase